MNGKIIRIVSKEYTVLSEDGKREEAILSGKIRQQVKPVTGDLVIAEHLNNRLVIEKILPRRNRLIRPAVSNVDQALIVMSVKDPDFSPALIDRLTMLICSSDVTPVLIVSKCDLGIDEETESHIREYEEGPMQVIRMGRGWPLDTLENILKGKISVLTGQSGAGKSSLLNQLEPSFHLATQEISKALGRGKHTTRHNELHEVAGGLVADTPGFSSLDFTSIEADELAEYIPDFQPYLHACRFSDCIHQNEPGCAVKNAVEEGKIPAVRYEDYLQVLRIIQERRKKYI